MVEPVDRIRLMLDATGSDWHAGIAAALVIANLSPQSVSLQDSSRAAISEIFEEIQQLPPGWAREIAELELEHD